MTHAGNVMKKTFALLLSIIVLMTMVPANVFATNNSEAVRIIASGDCGKNGDNIIWQLDSENTLTISGNGAMADYTWTNTTPTTPWYEYKSEILKIVVSDGIETIGSCAFYRLSYATSIEITNDIVSLKTYAFARCSKMQTIDLPDNLQYIGDYCFESCNSLSSIIIPKTVTKLGDCVFTGCTSLTDVQLPSQMTILPRGFFSECTSLENITIPNGVTELVSYCFRECTNLKNITLPETLTTIGYRAFEGCTELETIKLPDTVTTLSSEIFYNCTGLINIKLSHNLETIPQRFCFGCTKLQFLEIPSSVTKIENSAFSNCTNLNDVILQEGLEEIGNYAFYNCSKISTMILPKSVKSIGENSYGFYTNNCDEKEVMPNAKLYCYENSIGITYAESFGISYSIIDIYINSLDCEYTGNPVTPNIEITIDNQDLKLNTDFTVVYENNIDIGLATAKITFINDYNSIKSTVKKNYHIGNLLNNCEITLDKDEYQYHAPIPNVTIKSDNYILEYGKDYEVYYTLAGEMWKKPGINYSRYLWEIGDCSVNIVGINQYVGEKEIIIPVNKYDMANAKLWTNWSSNTSHSYDMKNFEYDGTAKKQSGFRVCDDNDTISTEHYDISYKNNTNVGTATMIITGKGDYYTGTLEKQFEIYPRQISSIEVTKLPQKTIYSSGESKIDVTGGEITVYYQDGGQETIKMKVSMLDGDYNLSMVGTQNIWLTYKDCSTYFEVTTIEDLSAPKKVSAKLYGYDDVKISWSKVAGADAYYVYYKKSTAKSYTKLGRTTKTSYSKSNLSDGVKYYFKIVPCSYVNETYCADESYKTSSIYTLKKVSTPKVKKSSTKVKVSWTNISGETGYQISQSTKKSGTNVVATYKTTSGKSKTISAKKGKTYYYKVRAYKVVNGKKIYAPWSSPVKYTRK